MDRYGSTLVFQSVPTVNTGKCSLKLLSLMFSNSQIENWNSETVSDELQ